MAQRYFNWKLAFVLVVALVVFAAAALALHNWQQNTRAERALPLGQQAYEQGDWEEAARQLGRYLAVDRNNVPILLQYAGAQLKIRPMESAQVQQAIAAYSAALRLESGNAEAARNLVELYLGMETYGEAELKARQFLENNDEVSIRRYLGVALVEQRKFREGGEVLSALVQEHPDQILAYDVLGRLAHGRPADVNEPALYWFDKAIELNPDAALAYIARGAFYWDTGDSARAMADLEHAETLDLSDTMVHLRLAGELTRMNAIDKAREHLTMLMDVAPEEQRLWDHWADVAVRSGSQEEMKTVAEEGLKHLARQPWDFMPRAVELFIRTDQPERAQDYILQMKEKNIQPARVAFLEGMLAEQRGHFREAITAWERAIGLGYQSPQDRRWGGRPPFVRVVLASAHLKMGDIQAAIGHLRTLVAQMPTQPGAYLLLARLEAQTGDWEAAMQHARRLRQMVPNHKEAVLLELRARVRQLAATEGSASGGEAGWRDVEARLAQLAASETEEAAALQIALLQVESALFQQDYDRAETLLDRLQQNHPDERPVALLRAQTLTGQGKIEEAAGLLRQIAEQSPPSTEAVTQLAILLDRQGDRAACEAIVKEALTRTEETRIRRLLGLFLADFYASWGEDDQRYDWLIEMADQFPDDVTIKRRLLSFDRVLANVDQAQQLIEAIKAHEGEKGWQWKIEQAKLWIRSDSFDARYAEAVRLLQENLLANPEDQASRMLLGAAYDKAGEMRLALATYREALNRSKAPDNLQILLVLAAAYEKNDDHQEALTLYRRALRQAPGDIRVIGRMVGALHRIGEFEEAKRVLDDAAQRDIHHADLQKLRLEGDWQRGALNSASDILQQMVQEDPNDTSAQFAMALLRARQERFEEAQTILADLRAKHPEDVGLTEAQIQVYILQGREDDAIRLSSELVERLASVRAYALRARTYGALGQYDEALEDLDRTVALEPNDPGVWLMRANFYRDLGRTDDEVRDVEKALALAPDDLAIQRRAMQLFLVSRDPASFRRAEAILQQAITEHPDNVELKALHARVLLSKGTAPDLEEAERLLNQVVDENPEQVQAWELLGRLELRMDRWNSASDTALRGLAHNPDARTLLLLKADAEAQGAPSLALPTLRELLRQDPNDLDVLTRLASVTTNLGEPEKMRELVGMLEHRLAVLEGPARRRGETILAATLYRNGQVEEAQAHFESLLKADANDSAPLLTWARLPESVTRSPRLRPAIENWVARHPDDTQTLAAMTAEWVGRRDAAGMRLGEGLLKAALQRTPRSLGALLVLADLAGVRGRGQEAAQFNRRVLEIDPNNVMALNNLAWFLCEEERQYQEALALANRGLERSPTYLDLIDTRGVIHYRMGNLDLAVKDFEKCVELCPPKASSLATMRFHLARTYHALGNEEEAARHLQRIVGLEDDRSNLSADDQAEAKLLLDQVKKGS